MRIILEVPESDEDVEAFQRNLTGPAKETLKGHMVQLMEADGSWRYVCLQMSCLDRFAYDSITPMTIRVE